MQCRGKAAETYVDYNTDFYIRKIIKNLRRVRRNLTWNWIILSWDKQRYIRSESFK